MPSKKPTDTHRNNKLRINLILQIFKHKGVRRQMHSLAITMGVALREKSIKSIQIKQNNLFLLM